MCREQLQESSHLSLTLYSSISSSPVKFGLKRSVIYSRSFRSVLSLLYSISFQSFLYSIASWYSISFMYTSAQITLEICEISGVVIFAYKRSFWSGINSQSQHVNYRWSIVQLNDRFGMVCLCKRRECLNVYYIYLIDILVGQSSPELEPFERSLLGVLFIVLLQHHCGMRQPGVATMP